MRKKFTFWHSVASMLGIIVLEAVLVSLIDSQQLNVWVIVLGAAVGSIVNLYVTTEVIEEVKSARHMFMFLTAVLVEFLLFFAMQYAMLLVLDPASFPTLTLEFVTLLLHSTYVFVFNPLYLPATLAGRSLLLVNTVASIGLVVFILQNLSQLRRLTAK